VFVGKYNPSGRLPVTFPKRIEDCPAFSSFPGEQAMSEYSEGIYVGYKWWDLTDTLPQFPLGFGLSYNTFEVKSGQISSSVLSKDSVLTLSAHVRNTGGSDVSCRETVIAWCSQRPPKRLRRPKKQVCAFVKSPALSPGEESVVKLQLDAYSLGVYDPKKGKWLVDANGKFDIFVGTTALNASPAWVVEVPEEITWVHKLN
ncbi:glycoside hydrolase family protein, partial [Dactylonectria estremocensis]